MKADDLKSRYSVKGVTGKIPNAINTIGSITVTNLNSMTFKLISYSCRSSGSRIFVNCPKEVYVCTSSNAGLTVTTSTSEFTNQNIHVIYMEITSSI